MDGSLLTNRMTTLGYQTVCEISKLCGKTSQPICRFHLYLRRKETEFTWMNPKQSILIFKMSIKVLFLFQLMDIRPMFISLWEPIQNKFFQPILPSLVVRRCHPNGLLVFG